MTPAAHDHIRRYAHVSRAMVDLPPRLLTLALWSLGATDVGVA